MLDVAGQITGPLDRVAAMGGKKLGARYWRQIDGCVEEYAQ
ncbi:hypothetical protein [Dokdonella sp.]|nr:hypothetical protein [Dokdonella sp.]